MIRKFILSLCLLVAFVSTQAQYNPPFAQDIEKFKKKDSAHFPKKHAILFIGSSSFTKWTDVQEYFPGYTIINRGFGASAIPDVIRFANEIVYPYEPRQVVIYCGDNDFAYSPTIQPATVVYRAQLLVGIIRTLLPNARIDYVSIKYSPSREKFWGKIKTANAGIARFMKTQKNAGFIDITKPMSKGKQVVDESLFLEDRLHMKPSGYAIWKKAILPYLIKE